MTVEERLKYLEEKVEALIGMKNLHHEHLTGAKPLESFSVVSPDGKRKITLNAANDVATISIIGPEGSAISIYNHKDRGPIIGVRSESGSPTDIALSCKGGPTIQFFDKKSGSVYFVDPKAVSQITTAEKV